MNDAAWTLLRWITEEHRAPISRFERSVAGVVPRDAWRDPAGAGGASIAWLVLHTAYHEDLAVNAVVRASTPLMTAWRSDLGLVTNPHHQGLAEAEEPELTSSLDLDALERYQRAVHENTAAWLASVVPGALARTPSSGEALESAGIAAADVPWLYAMWADQPVSFYLSWEATGHRMQHVGEMVSVRNRLGLSPF